VSAINRYPQGDVSTFVTGSDLFVKGQAIRVQCWAGGCGSQISRQSAREGGKVVGPTHLLPLSPGNIPDTHFY